MTKFSVKPLPFRGEHHDEVAKRIRRERWIATLLKLPVVRPLAALVFRACHAILRLEPEGVERQRRQTSADVEESIKHHIP